MNAPAPSTNQPPDALWSKLLGGGAAVAGTLVLAGSTLGMARLQSQLPAGVLLLAGGNLFAILVFTLVMGAAQGVITIVRGAVPLALFGAEGYGSVLGLIATPVVVVNATAPTIFALIVDHWGWRAGELVLLVTCAASWIAMELMSRWYERARRL